MGGLGNLVPLIWKENELEGEFSLVPANKPYRLSRVVDVVCVCVCGVADKDLRLIPVGVDN